MTDHAEVPALYEWLTPHADGSWRGNYGPTLPNKPIGYKRGGTFYSAEQMAELEQERDALRAALRVAEAALADIGDADREPGDDLAWCEARAHRALPAVRAALADKGTT